jgi:hypothetical protein
VREEHSVSEEEKPATTGCGGVIGGISVAVTLCGAALGLRKKKE